MAETAIPITAVTFHTPTADLADADGTAIVTGADGGRVSAVKRTENLIFRLVDAGGAGDDVTFKAGDSPPSERVGLGDLVVAMAANDVKFVSVEAARFVKSNGSILITSAGDNATKVSVLRIKEAN